ncbi:MAG: glycosyltransferase family 9 protein [Gammaproteobacteria bacterium]|nr:glycosyltransferase family 9 protein [Gammaproteobacteria bacterium]
MVLRYDLPPVAYEDSLTQSQCLVRNKDTGSVFQENHQVQLKQVIKKLLWVTYLKLTGNYAGLSADIVPPDAPKAVIITAGGNLGGAIMSIPLIEAARERWPKTHLAVVANTQAGADIIKFTGLGDSHHVAPAVVLDKSLFHTGYRAMKTELRSFKKTLSKLQPEVLIDNHNYGIARLMLDLNIPTRIGHVGVTPNAEVLTWDDFYNIKVPCHQGLNWLAAYADLAKSFDGVLNHYPSIIVDSASRDWATKMLREAGLRDNQKAIAVQAGVWQVQDFKQWPIASLVKTCSDLWSKEKIAPVVFGTPGQEDVFAIIKAELPPEANPINMIGRTTSAEFACLLSVCAATLANDSGIMHLSAAVGTPTIAIYGMTNPEITWCYGSDPKHRIVRRPDISPCYGLHDHLIQACEDRPCLSGINHDIVTSTIRDVMN